MKHLITALLLLTLHFTATAQTRPSLTKKVNVLETQNQDLETRLAATENVLADVSAKVDTLQTDAPAIKIPTTTDEANALLVYVLGFLQFVFVGIWGKNLPKWLSPFILSVIVGLGIAVAAYFLSGGEFTVGEATAFFFAVLGVGNTIHQVKKPQAKTRAAPTP